MKNQVIALWLFARHLLTSASAQEAGTSAGSRRRNKSHQSLARRRARVRAMEAAGNHGWLRGQRSES